MKSNLKMLHKPHSSKQLFAIILLSILLFFDNGQGAVVQASTIHRAFGSDNYNLTVMEGPLAAGQFGAEIEHGDINDDGLDDLIIGSPFASTNMGEWNGAVFVYFGKKRPILNKNSAESPDISFFGETSGDQLGTDVAVGDFNNDGVDDMALGAYNAKYEKERPGKVYVIYGKKNWIKKSYNFHNFKPETLIIGHKGGDFFGQKMIAEDLNRDAYTDLLIGAPLADSPSGEKTGAVYLFYGASRGIGGKKINLNESQPDAIFFGKEDDGRFGSAIAAGNITRGAYKDLIISSYNAATDHGAQAGKIHIFKGAARFSKANNLQVSEIEGAHAKSWLGYSLATADINNDRHDDLIAGSFAYGNYNKNGKITVFYGGNRFSHKNAILNEDETANVNFENPEDELYLGATILTEDFNNDGLKDIFMGAPGIGLPKSEFPGKVYGFFGKNYDLNGKYEIKQMRIDNVLIGENPDDWFGFRIGQVDFNNDGYKDLVAGARYADNAASSNTGKIYIFLGSEKPFGELYEIAEPNDRLITRGEFTSLIIKNLQVKEKKADFIENCYQFMEFCFFNFTAMSSYDSLDISSKEPALYPDVPKNSRYYDEITLGTMLGLINGYMLEQGSPFKPEAPVSRIQALKIILTAAGLVAPKYKFEFSDQELNNQNSDFIDIDGKIPYMWWYPRYANFAREKGIIAGQQNFRPDQNITNIEAEIMINNTITYLNSANEKNQEKKF